jgi:hypothetical protein
MILYQSDDGDCNGRNKFSFFLSFSILKLDARQRVMSLHADISPLQSRSVRD